MRQLKHILPQKAVRPQKEDDLGFHGCHPPLRLHEVWAAGLPREGRRTTWECWFSGVSGGAWDDSSVNAPGEPGGELAFEIWGRTVEPHRRPPPAPWPMGTGHPPPGSCELRLLGGGGQGAVGRKGGAGSAWPSASALPLLPGIDPLLKPRRPQGPHAKPS